MDRKTPKHCRDCKHFRWDGVSLWGKCCAGSRFMAKVRSEAACKRLFEEKKDERPED